MARQAESSTPGPAPEASTDALPLSDTMTPLLAYCSDKLCAPVQAEVESQAGSWADSAARQAESLTPGPAPNLFTDAVPLPDASTPLLTYRSETPSLSVQAPEAESQAGSRAEPVARQAESSTPGPAPEVSTDAVPSPNMSTLTNPMYDGGEPGASHPKFHQALLDMPLLPVLGSSDYA